MAAHPSAAMPPALHSPGPEPGGVGLCRLVGDRVTVPCVDGGVRRYVDLDAAASTPALPGVAERVTEFLPWYSSVHRGAGYKSQLATAAYEGVRAAILRFAGRGDGDVAIICRNTTEAINHLAHSLRLRRSDVVVTTVVEHHANLLPWRRAATCRYVECGLEGTFEPAAVRAALEMSPRPRLLTVTGASNVTGWLPPLDTIIELAHERGVPVLVDAAQLAPHRPMPPAADFVAFSGHKMYAPFGAGALIGPRAAFTRGDPFLVGGGAVELVTLDEVVWTEPPDREEAGSPNVIGAVALAAAAEELARVGWDRIRAHDASLSRRLHVGLASIPGVRVLGPGASAPTLPIASFIVDGVPHALVAARLSAEFGIGVRDGRFCAHPYVVRLLGLPPDELERHRAAARRHDRPALHGAVRASASVGTTGADITRLLAAVAEIASTPPRLRYVRHRAGGGFWPAGFPRPGATPRARRARLRPAAEPVQ